MTLILYCSFYEPPHDKTNKMTVRPAKTQISLGIRPFWSESSMCIQWVATTKRPKLSSCGHAILLDLSWGGSYSNDGQFETAILS